MPAKRIKIDLGSTYGRLTVMSCEGVDASGRVVWLCKCSCGNTRVASSSVLANRDCPSCGCRESEKISVLNKKHGLVKHPLYAIWSGMKKRCCTPSYEHYDRYGGIGVKVCAEWLADFINFYNWALKNGWGKGLTIDRFPNKAGNYEPSNCRWATMIQQANNKTNNRMLTVDGVTKTLSQFSRQSGVKITTIHARLKAGWSECDAVKSLL